MVFAATDESGWILPNCQKLINQLREGNPSNRIFVVTVGESLNKIDDDHWTVSPFEENDIYSIIEETVLGI